MEKTNVLQVTIDFYRSYKYNIPSKSRRDSLRKQNFQAQCRQYPVLVSLTLPRPESSSHPVTFLGPVPVTTIVSGVQVVLQQLVAV